MAFPFPFPSPVTPYDVGLHVCASSILQEETPGHPEADKEHYPRTEGITNYSNFSFQDRPFQNYKGFFKFESSLNHARQKFQRSLIYPIKVFWLQDYSGLHKL